MRVNFSKIFLIAGTVTFTSCHVSRGNGGSALGFLVIILLPLLIGVFVAIYRNEKHQLKYLESSKGVWSRYKGLFLFFIITAVSMVGVQMIGEPDLHTTKERLEHAIETGQYETEVLYRKQYFEESRNQFDVVFNLVVKMDSKYDDYIDLLNRIDKKVIESESATDADLFFKASLEYTRKQYQKSISYLVEIDSSYTMVNYLKGLNSFKLGEPDTAVYYLNHEILLKGNMEDAYNLLGYYYIENNELEALYSLAVNDKNYEYLSTTYSSRAFWFENDFPRLILSNASFAVKSIGTGSVIGAFLIFLVWFYYLNSANPFESFYSDLGTYITVFLSSGSLILIFPVLSSFFQYTLGFQETDTFLGNISFYTLAVGLVEELTKIIPVLVIYVFNRRRITSYEFVFYAALSGLTFGTLENILYFERYDLDLIQVRGLMSILMHIMMSSITGYCLASAQNNKTSYVLGFLKGLLISSVLHGIFDTFLSEEFSFPLFSFLLYMFLIHSWGDMFNNTINLSSSFKQEQLERSISFKSIVMISLLFIILFEYVLIGFSSGTIVANDRFAASVFESGYLLVFIGVSIGRFDFFKGYWAPISFPKSIGDIIFPRVANERSFVNHRVKVLCAKGSGKLQSTFPLLGTIISRKVHKGITSYYLIDIDGTLNVNARYCDDKILVRVKKYDSYLHSMYKTEVVIFIVDKSVDLEEIKLPSKQVKMLAQGAIFKV